MKLPTIFIVLIAMLTAGCEDEDPGLSEIDNKPVVEAFLMDGQPLTVKVTRQIPFSGEQNEGEQAVEGLQIVIRSNGKSTILDSSGDGIYHSKEKAKAGQTYELSFDYLGLAVQASTMIPTSPVNFHQDRTTIERTPVHVGSGKWAGIGDVSQSVSLSWENPAKDYFMTIVDNLETNPVPIISNANADPNASRRFRGEPLQTDQAAISALSFQYFGRHQIVLFHLNPDYAALYKQSSTSSQNITTPQSSIVNGLGIFTGVNSDTLYVTVNAKRGFMTLICLLLISLKENI